MTRCLFFDILGSVLTFTLMKILSKLTVGLLAVAGASFAHAQYPDELTLKYAWDFNTLAAGGGGYSLDNQANSEGAGTISSVAGTSGDFRNYDAGVAGTNAAVLNSGALRVEGMGMSASTGITIAFAYQSNDLTWAGIFNTDLISTGVTMETNGISSNMQFAGGELLISNIPDAGTTYNSVIMTVDQVEQAGVTGSLISLFVYNAAGDLVGSDTSFRNANLTMDYFQLAHLNNVNDKNIFLDNLMIYEGAADSYHHHSIIAAGTLAADPFAAGSALQQLAPEPGTATLSLLALTGLLARRRRKTA